MGAGSSPAICRKKVEGNFGLFSLSGPWSEVAEKKEERKKYLKKRLILKTKPNLQFLLAVLFINVFGVVMIYSASYYYGPATYGYAPDYFFWNQLKNIGIGLVAMLIIFPMNKFVIMRHKDEPADEA